MTVNELILKNKQEVRRDSNLMSLYLKYFQEAFNRKPNCAGCTFASDWQKLVSFYSKKSVTLQKEIPMKTITIKKIQGKILSYQKGGKTFRLYDNILNDAFIKEYISNGTESEIEQRKKLFNFPTELDLYKKEVFAVNAEKEYVEEIKGEETKSILLVQDENGIKAFDEKGGEKEIIYSEKEPIVKKRARKSKK